MRHIQTLLLFVFIINTSLTAAYGQSEPRSIGPSGYPLPRFMSLDDEINNMRTGPSTDYPIDWIYQKAGYPLKVIAEYDNWFKIIDVDGTTGWIARVLLGFNRRGIIINDAQKLIKSPDEPGRVTVIAEQDVVGTILRCENNWCEMEVGGFTGWIESKNIWGVLDQENFD